MFHKIKGLTVAQTV